MRFFKKRRQTVKELRSSSDRSWSLGVGMLLLLWLVITVMLSLPRNIGTEGKLIVGQEAPLYLHAKFAFSYEDRDATLQARRQALDEEPLFYEISSDASNRQRQNFKNFFLAVGERLTAPENVLPKEAESSSYAQMANRLTPDELKILQTLLKDENFWFTFERELDSIINGGIFSTDEKNARKAGQKVRIIDLAGRERSLKSIVEVPDGTDAARLLAEKVTDRKALRDIFTELLGVGGNLIYQQEKTAKNQQAAAERVAPVTINIAQNEQLVAKKQIVTPELLECLEAYSQAEIEHNRRERDYRLFLQNAIWSFVLVLFIGFYMYHIHPEIVSSNRKLGLLGGVSILALLINYLAMELFFSVGKGLNLSPMLAVNAIPFTLASVVLASILGFRVAIYVGFLVSAIMAMMVTMPGKSFEVAIMGMAVCSLAALAVRNAVNYRTFFIRTFLAVALATWLLDLNIDRYIHEQHLILQSAILSIINGFATAILALVVIFFFELVFNVSTNMSLMLLADYSHPLLERLKREAPGTFFHSMMVATLAEDAARAIHANPLKGKCGALFHDIGKLSKPCYFTENNLNEENRHLALNPQMSSIIIRDHVKEGLYLARKYKLNRVVRDAIEQHHGNDLVHYFYNRALEGNKLTGTPVDEAQFRYQGRPPETKEMVIVSLADACEAASRSLEKPSAGKIEAVVDEIFRKRFRDNQLVNADITLGELKKVRDSFVSNLVNMRHGRIAYTKEENQDESDLFMGRPGETGTPGANKV